jgi:hypothetical protein
MGWAELKKLLAMAVTIAFIVAGAFWLSTYAIGWAGMPNYWISPVAIAVIIAGSFGLDALIKRRNKKRAAAINGEASAPKEEE